MSETLNKSMKMVVMCVLRRIEVSHLLTQKRTTESTKDEELFIVTETNTCHANIMFNYLTLMLKYAHTGGCTFRSKDERRGKEETGQIEKYCKRTNRTRPKLMQKLFEWLMI